VLALQTVFAIVGMRLFLGAFASCTDEAITTKAACVGLDDGGWPRDWENPSIGNFDSWGGAMLTLFQAATADTLPDLIFHGMDAVGPDLKPQPTDWSMTALYFILWLLVGNLMALSLFVGAIVDNFRQIRSRNDGSALLTAEQVQWVNVMRETKNRKAVLPPLPPTILKSVRMPLYKLVLSSRFQNVMLVILVININTLAFDYHKIEEDVSFYRYWLTVADCFFYFYWCEFSLKFFALGPHGYFGNAGRQFEFSMLCASVVERSVSGIEINPMVLRMLRVSRALRILRVLQGKNAGDLRDLLHTLITSGPAMANVASILALVMFIYAVLGMHLFTWVLQNDGINNHANFETFSGACLLLFQVLTGDSWSGVMYGAMVDESLGCDPHATPSNCGSMLAVPYFVSYILIGTFVFLNLVVAIVLENFSSAAAQRDEKERRERENLPELINSFHLEDFARFWSEFDTNGDGFIQRKAFPYVVAQLHFPFGTADRSLPLHDSDEGAMEAGAAAAAATKGADQVTWVPDVPAAPLERAQAVVAGLKKIDGTSALTKSTPDEIYFTEALQALIEHAFTCEIGTDVGAAKPLVKNVVAVRDDDDDDEDDGLRDDHFAREMDDILSA